MLIGTARSEGDYEADALMEANLIDTHSHILPAVDDGAVDYAMALGMARIAVSEGISKIVATPHPDPVSGIGSRTVTLRAVDLLQTALLETGIEGLQILPGTECYLTPELLPELEQEKLIGLNCSRYILLEMNYQVAPVNAEQVMYRLRNAGYVPVIAHPERYKFVQQDFFWMARLVRLGCLGQITAGAVYGRFGKRCQKAAEELLQRNLVHVVASDAHNLTSRLPGLSTARPVIERIAGIGAFERMAVEVPGRIVSNLPYEPDLPEAYNSKSFWKFLSIKSIKR